MDEPFVIEYHTCARNWETVQMAGGQARLRCTFVHLDGVRCGNSMAAGYGFLPGLTPRTITRAAIVKHLESLNAGT